MKYLTVKKASKYLNISEEKIRDMCRSNRFKGAQKNGIYWIIPKREITSLKPFKLKIIGGTITLWIMLVASIFGIIDYSTNNFISKKISTSFIVPKIKPASENEILILVMDFEQKGQNNYDISGRIAEELTRNLTLISGSNVHVRQIKESIPRSEIFAPSAVGTKYNATILIWGSYDDAGIRPSFAIPSTLPHSSQYSEKPTGVKIDQYLPKIASEIGLLKDTNIPKKYWNHSFTIIGKGIEFIDFPAENSNRMEYIRNILPNSMTYLSALVIGILYYYKEEYSTSSQYLDLSIDLSKSVDIRLGLDKAYYYQGMIFLDDKEFESSIFCFNQAISENNSCYRAYIYRSQIYRILGKYLLAKQDCEFVLKENFSPGYYITKSHLINLYRNYARTCLELNMKDISEEYYQKVLEYKDDINGIGVLTETYSNLGTIKYSRNDLESAFQSYIKVIEIDSTIAYPYFWLSVIYRDFKQLDSAEYYLNKYKELETDTSKRNLFLRIY